MKLAELALTFIVAAPLFAAEPAKGPPPAKVEKPVKESELANLTLTPEAEKRLAITTAAVQRRKFEGTRLFGGEIILPARNSTNANDGVQSIFSILPSLSSAELVRLAQSQIDADGQLDQARVQLDGTKFALTRADRLLKDKAGSERAVDEAKLQVALGEAALRTAQARRDLLGAPVLDFANQKSFWVRVPVYVGDVARLNTTSPSRVGPLSPNADATIPAQPVSAPPSANASAGTVDLFYEVSNTNNLFRFGQRVGVTIPLRGEEESLVVPWAAVLHDVNGGTWVYEKLAPQSYARRRVQVKRVIDGIAAIADGLKPGANVAITGAAELFGTEFGVGK
jgi:hypothetical protein